MGNGNSKYAHFLVGAGQAGQDHDLTKGLASRLSRPKRPLTLGRARRRGDKVTCLSQTIPRRPAPTSYFELLGWETAVIPTHQP